MKELQKELSDRDNVISQLYEQMSVTSFQTSPINSPYVMSPGTRSPGDRSPDADKTPPLGCSVDSVASSFFAANYKSSLFTDKDNKIIELTETNIDLERKLLDMEENLRAKEELVRVRTAAEPVRPDRRHRRSRRTEAPGPRLPRHPDPSAHWYPSWPPPAGASESRPGCPLPSDAPPLLLRL